jgi:single-strand DNA-binding protein
MNRITLIGRIGQDPETKTAGNTTVTVFSLATSQKHTNKDTGEAKEYTQWHRLESWGKQGEIIAKYHKKGDRICIEGMLNYDQYENKEGVKMTAAKVRVERFEFVKDSGVSNTERTEAKPTPQPIPAGEQDDMPF